MLVFQGTDSDGAHTIKKKKKKKKADVTSNFTHPLRSLKSMQPNENQSALLSYAVPF